MYYIAHNNTKFYYIYYIFLQSQQKSKRACQIIQQIMIICIKIQIDQEQSELIDALQGLLNEFILAKRLEETAQHKYYGIRQIKDLQPINLESNKTDVISLTNFYNFLKIILN